ncbi:response regulator [Pectobacterium brasiliense]|uniref:response regulator n=1 Tax=Pectobacterium brasiliense TaxID=180957 RepID=UPI0032EBDE5A
MIYETLIKSTGDILQGLAVLLLSIMTCKLLHYLSPIIKKMEILKFKYGDVEVYISQKVKVVADSLYEAERAKGNATFECNDKIKTDLSGWLSPAFLEKIKCSNILWVDDRIDLINNEIKALNEVGINVQWAISTSEALGRINEMKFDLVISDMGRPEGVRAGYSLLDEVKRIKPDIPFIIYAGSNDIEHRREANKRGAFGSTNNAYELFNYILCALILSPHYSDC